MKSREVARQVLSLIRKEHRHGNVLKKTIHEVWRSLLEGNCVWVVRDGIVVAAAIITESERFLQIGSLVVHEDYRKRGLAYEVVKRSVELGRGKQEGRLIVAVAGSKAERIFEAIGFQVRPKEEAGEELWGGRSCEEWLNCQRKYMVLV